MYMIVNIYAENAAENARRADLECRVVMPDAEWAMGVRQRTAENGRGGGLFCVAAFCCIWYNIIRKGRGMPAVRVLQARTAASGEDRLQ